MAGLVFPALGQDLTGLTAGIRQLGLVLLQELFGLLLAGLGHGFRHGVHEPAHALARGAGDAQHAAAPAGELGLERVQARIEGDAGLLVLPELGGADGREDTPCKMEST